MQAVPPNVTPLGNAAAAPPVLFREAHHTTTSRPSFELTVCDLVTDVAAEASPSLTAFHVGSLAVAVESHASVEALNLRLFTSVIASDA